MLRLMKGILIFLTIVVTGSFGQTLIYHPTDIVPGLTENVTLTCDIGSSLTGQKSVISVKIKKYSSGTWNTVVDVKKGPNSAQLNVGRVVTYDITNMSSAFVEIRWPKAINSTFGTYRCDVVTFDTQGDVKTFISSKSNLTQKNLGIRDVLKIVIEERETLDILQRETNQLTAFINQTVQAISQKTDKIFVDEASVDKRLQTLESFAQSFEIRLNTTIDNYEKTVNEITPYFSEMWPEGTYGIHKPNTGCPLSDRFTWQEGYVQIHTESTDPRNGDQVSNGNHLAPQIIFRLVTNNYVYLRFCVVTQARSSRQWPKGNYCIGKYTTCPRGFSDGTVHADHENVAPAANSSGYVITSGRDADMTTLNFCCRADADSTQPILLPTSRAFYLYKFKSNPCPQVRNMKLLEEFIILDTENTGNKDSADPNTPPSSLNPIKFDLCYYYP